MLGPALGLLTCLVPHTTNTVVNVLLLPSHGVNISDGDASRVHIFGVDLLVAGELLPPVLDN